MQKTDIQNNSNKQVVILNEIREKVKQDYLEGMKYKDICEKYNLSINTLKSWIKRYGWADEKKYQSKQCAPKKKRGAPIGNKNAVGNNGGAPPKNKNAEKHGFFSKYLPEETIDIIQEIKEKNPLDILWENIQIQYAAIIRAQKIMFVKDRNDKTVEKVEERRGKVIGERWEVQQAWDKQANFLQAQSRAMAELRNMIKQYEELCNSELVTEEQKMRIKKLKVEIERVEGDEEELKKLDKLIEAIDNEAKS
ncbi:MAG: phage protein [Thermoanaerobacter sp.]|jgi:uncharacterized protein YjcR|nr:phage protein [Thermoanaerobacter sp.]